MSALAPAHPAEAQAPASCIVNLGVQGEQDNHFLGITVDAVSAVRHIDSNNIEPTPSFGTHIRADFMDGMAKVNGSFVILLDSGKVSSPDEISLLKGMTASNHPSAEG